MKPEARPLTEIEAARMTIDSLVAQNRLAISLLRELAVDNGGECQYCLKGWWDDDHMCELKAFLENL